MLQCIAKIMTDPPLASAAKTKDQNTLQKLGTHCNTLEHFAQQYKTPQYSAEHCNTLQHNAG